MFVYQLTILTILENGKCKQKHSNPQIYKQLLISNHFVQNHIHFLKDPILNERFPHFPFSNRVHFLPDLASFHWNMSVSSFEVNAAAAMRDYYVEPRLGRELLVGD